MAAMCKSHTKVHLPLGWFLFVIWCEGGDEGVTIDVTSLLIHARSLMLDAHQDACVLPETKAT